MEKMNNKNDHWFRLVAMMIGLCVTTRHHESLAFLPALTGYFIGTLPRASDELQINTNPSRNLHTFEFDDFKSKIGAVSHF